MTTEPGAPRCPHGADERHGGLGKGWCDAGLEGQAYLRARELRVKALRDKLKDAEPRDERVNGC